MVKKCFVVIIQLFLFSMTHASDDASQKKTLQETKVQVQKLGLSQKITVQDFLKKAKALQPDFQDAELEDLAKTEPQSLMPVVEMKSIDTPNGKVLVMLFTENGKTHTVQFFGDKEKYLKIDNKIVSEQEASDPESLSRILASEDKPKK